LRELVAFFVEPELVFGFDADVLFFDAAA